MPGNPEAINTLNMARFYRNHEEVTFLLYESSPESVLTKNYSEVSMVTVLKDCSFSSRCVTSGRRYLLPFFENSKTMP